MKNNIKTELNLKKAFGCFLAGYITVSLLATAVSVMYGIIYNIPAVKTGDSLLQAPSFVATVPYHLLIMFLVWPSFAWIYFRKRRQALKETMWLSTMWLVSAIIVDFVGFVLIRHPYSFTAYEFYVLYQPWISLIYISIFLSPVLQLVISRLANKKL